MVSFYIGECIRLLVFTHLQHRPRNPRAALCFLTHDKESVVGMLHSLALVA
jgi:hypothetical protein